MGRPFLIASTLYYSTAVVRTLLAVHDRIAPHGRFSFFRNRRGLSFPDCFSLGTGPCAWPEPLTNLFEVFVFLARSVALVYLMVGPAYRLLLMGAVTAPLVFAPQTFAVVGSELIPSRADRKHTIHCIHLGSGNRVRENWQDQLPKA